MTQAENELKVLKRCVTSAPPAALEAPSGSGQPGSSKSPTGSGRAASESGVGEPSRVPDRANFAIETSRAARSSVGGPVSGTPEGVRGNGGWGWTRWGGVAQFAAGSLGRRNASLERRDAGGRVSEDRDLPPDLSG